MSPADRSAPSLWASAVAGAGASASATDLTVDDSAESPTVKSPGETMTLVMELVEGPTLTDRIAPGPVAEVRPADEPDSSFVYLHPVYLTLIAAMV